jgi:hypothetical protein
MKVLVCGGRDFDDYSKLCEVLDGIDKGHMIRELIHGAARGADRLAAQWAWAHGVPVNAFAANWSKEGRSAGPLRNQRMLELGKPDLVVAFKGGRGTADMVARARAAGVEVREVR